MTNSKAIIGNTITIGVESYKILALGVTREDGTIYAHLASTTRFCNQRNGKVPVQIVDFFTPSQLGVAA